MNLNDDHATDCTNFCQPRITVMDSHNVAQLYYQITDEQLLTLQKGEHVYKQVAISYTMGYFILNPFNL